MLLKLSLTGIIEKMKHFSDFYRPFQMQKKKAEMESKKDGKKENRKYPSSMEKIVDMPLIASANLISVVQRNESTNEAEESSVDGSTNLDTGNKSEKKNTCRGQAAKSNERARNGVEQAQKIERGARIEYDFTKMGAKTLDGLKGGIELTLTPLAKNEAEDAAESDRSMMIGGGKEASKVVASSLTSSEGGKGGKQETRKKRGFGGAESRECSGEPDGREDEKDAAVEQPPALPKSPPPPPAEARPPPTLAQGETFNKQPIVTEPRPSFLHGAINSEAKVKPLVPQKPTNFSAKSNSVEGKNNCAPPPSPPVQQASGTTRSGQNAGKHFSLLSFERIIWNFN